MITCTQCGFLEATCAEFGKCTGTGIRPDPPVHWTWLHGPIDRPDPAPISATEQLKRQTERTRRALVSRSVREIRG